MTPGITVNTQSSIRIKGSDGIIRFDPFKITGEPHDTDMIFITHDHYDHFSPEDIRKVSKPGTVLIAPKNMAGQLKAQGFINILLLAPGETAALHNIRIEAVAAYNSLKPFHPKSGGYLGYIVTLDGLRIYAAGRALLALMTVFVHDAGTSPVPSRNGRHRRERRPRHCGQSSRWRPEWPGGGAVFQQKNS